MIDLLGRGQERPSAWREVSCADAQLYKYVIGNELIFLEK